VFPLSVCFCLIANRDLDKRVEGCVEEEKGKLRRKEGKTVLKDATKEKLNGSVLP